MLQPMTAKDFQPCVENSRKLSHTLLNSPELSVTLQNSLKPSKTLRNSPRSSETLPKLYLFGRVLEKKLKLG